MNKNGPSGVSRPNWSGIAAFALVLVAATAAQAHHPMDGQTPTTFWHGLLSGFGHPVIGLDHFAFIIAVGLASLALPGRFFMPAAFLVATAAGTLLHVNGMSLPAAELVIAGSVALLGALLIAQAKLPVWAYAALFAVAGLFHGYAYGEAVFGAETTPIVAYLMGFVVMQYAIAVGAMMLAERLSRSGGLERAMLVRVAGGVVAGIGVAFLYAASGIA